MPDLRTEIRSAFEQEQRLNPPAANLRDRVAIAVHSGPRRHTTVQWMAVVAALVIGALVVGGLMSTRRAPSATNAGPAPIRTTPRPSPVSDYGPPPVGVSLFYVADPRHAGWYIGFDWSGTPRGTVKTAALPNGNQGILFQSPNGSGFMLSQNGKGGNLEYLDRLGNPAGSGPASGPPFVMWAEDSAHYCQLDYNDQRWNISVQTAGSAPAPSHVVALDPSIAQSGIIAIGFRACDPSTDRALLAYSYSQRPTLLYLVRPSDGAILMKTAYDPGYLADITASPDGTLMAESSNKSTGYLLGGAAPNTVIRRTADGAVVDRLDPSIGVLAFSADDSVMLVNTSPWASGVATQLALMKVSDGSILWRYTGDEEYSGSWVQPNGSSIAIMLQPPRNQDPHATVDLTIVHADGTSTAIPGFYVRP